MGRMRGTPAERIDQMRRRVDAKLDEVLACEGPREERLVEAMRYGVLGGGKRIRPVLCLASYEAVGGVGDGAVCTAAAIELIHAYSLVHDDLPCMDDDALRRGRPTTHRAYGEGMAVLVGDALLTRSFELLAEPVRGVTIEPERRFEVLKKIARAAGVRGMIGGQAVELEAATRAADASLVEYVHGHKTAALIAVSVWAGARLGTDDAHLLGSLEHYGERIGFAFQVVDDLLDSEEGPEPVSYVGVHGKDRARQRAEALVAEAKEALRPVASRGELLAEIADRIVRRMDRKASKG